MKKWFQSAFLGVVAEIESSGVFRFFVFFWFLYLDQTSLVVKKWFFLFFSGVRKNTNVWSRFIFFVFFDLFFGVFFWGVEPGCFVPRKSSQSHSASRTDFGGYKSVPTFGFFYFFFVSQSAWTWINRASAGVCFFLCQIGVFLAF